MFGYLKKLLIDTLNVRELTNPQFHRVMITKSPTMNIRHPTSSRVYWPNLSFLTLSLLFVLQISAVVDGQVSEDSGSNATPGVVQTNTADFDADDIYKSLMADGDSVTDTGGEGDLNAGGDGGDGGGGGSGVRGSDVSTGTTENHDGGNANVTDNNRAVNDGDNSKKEGSDSDVLGTNNLPSSNAAALSPQDTIGLMSMFSTGIAVLKAYLNAVYSKIDHPSTCMRDTYRLADSAISKRKWALEFVDAAGKPGPSVSLAWLDFVGNRDQCEDSVAPFDHTSSASGNDVTYKEDNHSGDERDLKREVYAYRGLYCILNFGIPNNDQSKNLKAKSDICIPDTCSESELLFMGNQIIGMYGFQNNLTVESVDCISGDTEVTKYTVMAIIMLTLTGLLMAAGTYYDVFYVQSNPDDKSAPPYERMETERINNGECLPNTSQNSMTSLSKKYDSFSDCNTGGGGGGGYNSRSLDARQSEHTSAYQGESSRGDKQDGMHGRNSSAAVLDPTCETNSFDQPNGARDKTKNGLETNGRFGFRSSFDPKDINHRDHDLSLRRSEGGDRADKLPKSRTRFILQQVLLAYSVNTNVRKLVSTRHSPDSIPVIHAVRYISIAWVVLGHLYRYGVDFAINRATAVDDIRDSWTLLAVVNAFPSVDTFYVISGTLIAFTTMGQMEKKGWKLNWLKFYLHRLWRLLPPYMALIIISLGLTQYLGNGSSRWVDDEPYDKKQCEDHLWKNVLFINNFWLLDETCMPHSWFLANDMQFHIISPLLIVPFYVHPLAGLGVCTAAIVASWTVTGALSSANHWAVNPLESGLSYDKLQEWQEDYYTRPYTRVGTYIVGVMAGYVLYKFKGHTVQMNRKLLCVGWVMAVGIFVSVVYGLHGDVSGDAVSSTDIRALYNAVSHTVWGVAVAWVILCCQLGCGGPVTDILLWKPFPFLGRITFMVYLIHPYVIHAFYRNAGEAFYYTDTTMAVQFVGILGLSSALAFVLALGLECPGVAMAKMRFGSRGKGEEGGDRDRV